MPLDLTMVFPARVMLPVLLTLLSPISAAGNLFLVAMDGETTMLDDGADNLGVMVVEEDFGGKRAGAIAMNCCPVILLVEDTGKPPLGGVRTAAGAVGCFLLC